MSNKGYSDLFNGWINKKRPSKMNEMQFPLYKNESIFS